MSVVNASVMVGDGRRVFRGITPTTSLFSWNQVQYERFTHPNGSGFEFTFSSCDFNKWERASSFRNPDCI